MAVTFQYRNLLAEDEFRLLRLPAGSGNEIFGSLHHFNLGSATCPPYRALSYTWDTDRPNIDLQMPQNLVMKIRKNLANALRTLRDSETDCFVWVDAICINQSSNEERNHQVKLMNTIYRTCNVVVVWLESSSSSGHAKAKDAFRTVRNTLHPPPPPLAVSFVDEVVFRDEPSRLEPGVAAGDFAWQALIDICNLRYWSRKWIIQEVISARTIVLKTSKASCSMADMETLFSQLDNARCPPPGLRLRSRSGYTYRQDLENTWAARLIFQRLRAGQDGLNSDRLYDWIERYADNQCSDPCDHVYALYNLSGEHRRHLDIDYSSPPVQRYCTVLDFVQRYERIPLRRASRFAQLLQDLLQISDDQLSQQRGLLNAYSLTMPVLSMALQLIPETEYSMRLRGFVQPIEPVATLLFRRAADADWTLVPNEVEIPYRVGRPDMVHFGIPGTTFFGLAGCRVEPTDCLWYFENIPVVFIVRFGPRETARAVGRAYVFSEHRKPVSASELDNWTVPDLSRVPGQREQTISISYMHHFSLPSLAIKRELAPSRVLPRTDTKQGWDKCGVECGHCCVECRRCCVKFGRPFALYLCCFLCTVCALLDPNNYD